MELLDSPRSAGRPRDPEVERGILTATQDLLVETGYQGTTIAAVAARAHCGKSAIYRRWPTKEDLVVAAVHAVQVPATMPDTGELRGDLLAAALHFSGDDSRDGAVLASLLAEIGRNAALREVAYRTIGGPPVATLSAVIARWIERGEVAPDTPVDLIANIVPTAAFGSVTLRQRSLEPETVAALVDHVLLPALRAPRD
ncbi:TetR/AcrR family transcriptional regulator [Herbiconiux moechotypicola]|uniref:TetR/AcrR family transcriptional regulator n=1 Tax=Herbiconiux moechotypicola TaxID=637393 RepID=UPI00217CD1D6|nr:TetR/AcrR family transcriptional regulator [Herbiconiux moechotypicola]MCS5730796.1 TetR/AcrR family transcriptional regulator [Herbiconiux moechotypicola]